MKRSKDECLTVNHGLPTEALVKCVSLTVAKPDCCATDGKLHQLTWAGRFRTPADGSGWEGGLNCFASMALSLAKLSQLPHRWPRVQSRMLWNVGGCVLESKRNMWINFCAV